MRLILFGVLGAILTGCAATEPVQVQYRERDNTSLYETRRIPLRTPRNSSNLLNQNKVMLQAEGSCEGADCVPEEIYLVFSNEGDSEMRFDYRSVHVEADTLRYDWEDLQYMGLPRAYSVSTGEFLRIPVDAAKLAYIAEADRVTLTFGASTYRASSNAREPLRQLAEMLRSSR